MKAKGYYLSLEAIVSMALLGLLLAMPLQESKASLNDLHVFKKENDLLIIWAKQHDSLNREKALQDFKFAFPGKSAEIFFDGKKIAIGKPGLESVASNAVFFDRQMKRHEIRLVVFKQDFG